MADAVPAQAAGASAAGAEQLTQLATVMASASPPPTDQEMAEAKAMPVRQYLESRVVPLLLQGMQRLVIERPVDPVEFLAKYLSDNNPRKKTDEKPLKEGEVPPADPASAPPAAAAPAPAAPAK